MRRLRAYRFLGLTMLGLFVLLVTVHGQEKPAAKDKSAATVKKESAFTPADLSSYVGAETCKTCHEDIYNNFEKTPHWKTTYDTHGGPSKQGCEACHGPGKAHV